MRQRKVAKRLMLNNLEKVAMRMCNQHGVDWLLCGCYTERAIMRASAMWRLTHYALAPTLTLAETRREEESLRIVL